MKLFSIALVTGALTAATAYAADATFTAVDTNGDGALTMEEVAIAMPKATTEAFASADIDRNGTLSEDEFVAAQNDGVLPVSG